MWRQPTYLGGFGRGAWRRPPDPYPNPIYIYITRTPWGDLCLDAVAIEGSRWPPAFRYTSVGCVWLYIPSRVGIVSFPKNEGDSRHTEDTNHKPQRASSPLRRYTSIYEGPYGRRVSEGPEGVVAVTRYRGLQISSLYLRQGESLPHVIGEGKECRRSSDRLGHRHIGLN